MRAAQQLAAKAAAGEIKPEEITEQLLSDAMYTAGQKDPDFILRPSGEKRLSNFMLWQAAYSELVEMDVLWPDLPAAIWTLPLRSSIIVPAGLADCKTQDLLHTVQGPDGPAALPEPNLIQRVRHPTGEKEIQSMKHVLITAYRWDIIGTDRRDVHLQHSDL